MSGPGHVLLRFRPPRISMLLLTLAAAAQWWILPVRVEWFSFPVLAMITAAAGFAIMMQAWWLFRNAETAICPTADSTTLVTSGVYRFTRNPMYLGIVLMMTATALWAGTLPFYLVTALYFIMIDRVFCPFEERRLEERFGSSFSRYRESVRRWL